MLSGNAPYYLGGASDEFLHKRLSANPGKTILQQDLEELATVRGQGRESASANAKMGGKSIVIINSRDPFRSYKR